MEFNKKINIVADCDEVLTYISPWWIYLISKTDYEYFSQFLYIPKNFNIRGNDVKKTLLRPKFKLEESYGNETFFNLSENEKKEFYDKYYDIINRDEFYTKLCRPTQMAYTLRDLAGTNYVEKIYIVSRCLSNNKNGKKELLEKIFGKDLIKSNKIEFHLLDLHEKKSDYINSIGKPINAFFDDELSNVEDVILNCKGEMDIYVPMLGYNRPDSKYVDINKIYELALENDKTVGYYQVIKGLQQEVYKNMEINQFEDKFEEITKLIDDETDITEGIKIDSL